MLFRSLQSLRERATYPAGESNQEHQLEAITHSHQENPPDESPAYLWPSAYFHPLQIPCKCIGLSVTGLNGGELPHSYQEINGTPVRLFYDTHISGCTDRCILIIGQGEIAVWEQTNEAGESRSSWRKLEQQCVSDFSTTDSTSHVAHTPLLYAFYMSG